MSLVCSPCSLQQALPPTAPLALWHKDTQGCPDLS